MKINRHQRQRGYVLLAVLFMLTLAIIALTAAAPSMITSIKREREIWGAVIKTLGFTPK